MWDREKVVIIPDHYIFTSRRDGQPQRRRAARVRRASRTSRTSTTSAPTRYKGVCHIALPEEGHTRPGEVLFGTDSHTCTAGAFGEFATGIGNTDAGFVMGTGKLLAQGAADDALRLPRQAAAVPDGQGPDPARSSATSAATAPPTRRWSSTATASTRLNIEERMTLCNMVIEAGGKNGVIAPDQVTLDYVRRRGRRSRTAGRRPTPARAFVFEKVYDVTKLEPVVAKPHSPTTGRSSREVEGRSSTGLHRLLHRRQADRLRRRRAGPARAARSRIDTFVVPATTEIARAMRTRERSAARRCATIFLAAGAKIGDASCAACLGGPRDTFGRLNGPESASARRTATSPAAWAQGGAGVPGVAVHGRGLGRHRPDHRPARDARGCAMTTTQRRHPRRGLRPRRQHRHRSDHPGPVPEPRPDDPRRVREARQLRARAACRRAATRRSCPRARRRRRTRSSSPARTSAAARRASTRRSRSARPAAQAVVAESYARIFFRNCVATGELYPVETPDAPRRRVRDRRRGRARPRREHASPTCARARCSTLQPLGDARPVIDAGGLFAYARQTGMIPAPAPDAGARSLEPNDRRLSINRSWSARIPSRRDAHGEAQPNGGEMVNGGGCRQAQIAIIPGDGTGPEVTAEAVKVLDAAARACGFTLRDDRLRLRRRPLPAHRRGAARHRAVDDLRKFDAILLGAIGHPDVKPGILEKGILLRLRFELDLYINLRPVKLYPGVETPLKDKGPERHRLRRRAREHRGPLRRRRRHAEARHARRGRGAGVDQHAQGRRALPALRVRVHAQAEPPEDAHALRQDQRAHLRVRPLGARLPRDRRSATTPTSSATTRTSTPPACGW